MMKRTTVEGLRNAGVPRGVDDIWVVVGEGVTRHHRKVAHWAEDLHEGTHVMVYTWDLLPDGRWTGGPHRACLVPLSAPVHYVDD
jgi:hypothetical protein